MTDESVGMIWGSVQQPGQSIAVVDVPRELRDVCTSDAGSQQFEALVVDFRRDIHQLTDSPGCLTQKNDSRQIPAITGECCAAIELHERILWDRSIRGKHHNLCGPHAATDLRGKRNFIDAGTLDGRFNLHRQLAFADTGSAVFQKCPATRIGNLRATPQ